MAAGPNNATVLTTLTVKKGASAASVSLTRRQDGSMQFTKTNGLVRTVQSSNFDFKALFDAINALV